MPQFFYYSGNQVVITHVKEIYIEWLIKHFEIKKFENSNVYHYEADMNMPPDKLLFRTFRYCWDNPEECDTDLDNSALI